MASIHHEPDRPRKPWRVTWRQDGRQRTQRFTTRREAHAFLGQLAEGRRHATTRWTLAAWLDHWLKTHGMAWEPRTQEDRAGYVQRLIKPHLGHQRLDQIARPNLREWRLALMREGRTAWVVNRATVTLSAALGAAVQDDILIANPCAGLRPLTVPEPDRRAATLTEAEGIRLHLHDPLDRLAVSLMAYAGLRPGEVRSITWGDITDHAVTVRRGERASGRTKTGSVRTVPILRCLREDLDAVARGEGRIMPPVDARNWAGRVWRPARARAGLGAHVTPYSLRHLYASMLIAEGRDVLQVAAMMGHANPTLTMDTYGHVVREAALAPTRARFDRDAMRARRDVADSHAASPE